MNQALDHSKQQKPGQQEGKGTSRSHASSIRHISPGSPQFELSYPSIESEFEVQAWLYMSLRDDGHDVRGEVNTYANFGSKRHRCRFDLVLYENGMASLILEVKAKMVKHKTVYENTRQCRRYRCFGVPIKLVYGMEGAKAVRKLLNERR